MQALGDKKRNWCLWRITFPYIICGRESTWNQFVEGFKTRIVGTMDKKKIYYLLYGNALQILS